MKKTVSTFTLMFAAATIFTAVSASSTAGAAVRRSRRATPRSASRPASPKAVLSKDVVINEIVASVVERPRVLIGTTNAERVLGSTAFALPMIRHRQRAELRAILRVNRQGAAPAYGASSNPEAYHMDVSYLTTSARSGAVRLNFRRASAPSPVGTRILTYDAPVSSSIGAGRLVAVVQQRAVPDQRVWKTTATFLRFISK